MLNSVLFVMFQYAFESLFRSLHFALMDNCCREYLFLCDFFMASGTSALDLFNVVLGKTLSIFLVCTASNLDSFHSQKRCCKYAEYKLKGLYHRVMSSKGAYKVANNVDPDQNAHQTDLDLHSLHRLSKTEDHYDRARGYTQKHNILHSTTTIDFSER